MMPGALTPGQRAHVDQTLAVVNEVERCYPFNQRILNDGEMERVILEDFMGGAWGTLRDDRAYLLWASTGRAVELGSPLTAADITRQVVAAAPTGDVPCDRCRVLTVPAGVAVVAVPRNLMAVVLCGGCADELRPDVLIPINQED